MKGVKKPLSIFYSTRVLRDQTIDTEHDQMQSFGPYEDSVYDSSVVFANQAFLTKSNDL